MTDISGPARFRHLPAAPLASRPPKYRSFPFIAFNLFAIPAPDGPETRADIGDQT